MKKMYYWKVIYMYVMARKKGINKLKTGFSIDKSINELFEEYCDERSINKSKLVNKILKEFLNGELEKEKTNN